MLIGGFVWWELHAEHPMLDLHWFRDRRFSVASGGIMLVFFAMFGMFFLITQYFQLVLGYGTFEAGLKQLPVAFSFLIIAPRTPRLSARIGAHRVVASGLVLVSVGLALFNTFNATTSYSWILVTMLLISGGMALTIAPLTASIMSAVPASRAGVGSAMNDTTRELGGALGVAVLGSLVLSTFQTELAPAISAFPEAVRNLADSGLAGALQAAQQIGGETGQRLAAEARDAYISGMGTACTIAAIVALIAAGIVWRFLRPKAQATTVVEGRAAVDVTIDGLEAAPEG